MTEESHRDEEPMVEVEESEFTEPIDSDILRLLEVDLLAIMWASLRSVATWILGSGMESMTQNLDKWGE